MPSTYYTLIDHGYQYYYNLCYPGGSVGGLTWGSIRYYG